MEFLQELLEFLQANNLNSFLISIVISVVGCFIAIMRTSSTSIKKKAGYVNLNQFNINDYVILFNGLILSFDDVIIKKKTELTKIDLNNFKDERGVLNATKKNE